MTEVQTPQETTTPAQPPAATPPAMDMELVKAEVAKATKEALADVDKRVAEAAEKKAQAKVQEAFKVLAGEEKKDEIPALSVQLIKDPVGTLSQYAKEIKEATVDEIKAQQAQRAKADAVANPFLRDYPEIAQHADIVEGLIRVKLEEGKPFEEAIKEGFETTVKRLGLKSAAEQAQARQVRTIGFPVSGGTGSGGATPGTPSNAESEASYIKALKERSKGFRILL